jgi:hypothetical protein
MKSAPHFLLTISDNSNGGWTDNSIAELKKELGLALEELQVESSSAGTPTCPSPRSAEAPADGIQSRECTETTSSRPDELQDTSRNGAAQGLKEWELQDNEVAVEGSPVVTQRQKVEHRFRLRGIRTQTPCWTPDEDDPVPNRMGGSVEQIRFLIQ